MFENCIFQLTAHGVHGIRGQAVAKLVEEEYRSGQEKLIPMKEMGERHVVAFPQSSKIVILERVQLVYQLFHNAIFFFYKNHEILISS